MMYHYIHVHYIHYVHYVYYLHYVHNKVSLPHRSQSTEEDEIRINDLLVPRALHSILQGAK